MDWMHQQTCWLENTRVAGSNAVTSKCRYSVVKFSKRNSSKHLEYTPKGAEEALKELFTSEVVTAEYK